MEKYNTFLDNITVETQVRKRTLERINRAIAEETYTQHPVFKKVRTTRVRSSYAFSLAACAVIGIIAFLSSQGFFLIDVLEPDETQDEFITEAPLVSQDDSGSQSLTEPPAITTPDNSDDAPVQLPTAPAATTARSRTSQTIRAPQGGIPLEPPVLEMPLDFPGVPNQDPSGEPSESNTSGVDLPVTTPEPPPTANSGPATTPATSPTTVSTTAPTTAPTAPSTSKTTAATTPAPAPRPVRISLTDRDITDRELARMVHSGEIPANVAVLYLNNNLISDITPLSSLTNLEQLWLNDNKIADVSALANMSKLTGLWLDDNRIEDFTPVGGLTALTSLSLNGNRVSDIAFVEPLANLKGLSLTNNMISDLTPLANHPNLEMLLLSENRLRSTDVIDSLPALTVLWLEGNRISRSQRSAIEEKFPDAFARPSSQQPRERNHNQSPLVPDSPTADDPTLDNVAVFDEVHGVKEH
ncbi:MAG: leucine-rich repeat domain-containing protein [Oscillospiraceae bacterium]|nr:leucine-rich repeat domain-containing protein [Oscillospiraceae bacterium]